MDQILLDLLKQSPSAVAVIVIVLIFVRYLDRRDEGQSAREDARNIILRQLNDACHIFHQNQTERIEKVFEKCRQAIEENTRELGQNTEAFRSAKERK